MEGWGGVSEGFSPPFPGILGVLRVFLPTPIPQKWRPFCLRFEGVVEDFNYGTLLRLDSRREYTEENTIFGGKRGEGAPGGDPKSTDFPGVHPFPAFSATRIQFFAIEIARNREGWNDEVYSSAREPAASEGKSG